MTAKLTKFAVDNVVKRFSVKSEAPF
jgi:hypothetical protein